MTSGTPLADIQIRDPFIVTDVAAGRYLLFGTGGFGEASHGGFVMRASSDLKTWSEPQPALTPSAGPTGATYFWAPEVVAYRGRWYLFGSFMHGMEIVGPEQRYTRLYVADTPEGPYLPLTDGPITPAGWWCIDGTLHVEPDGRPWLVFVREWLQVSDGEMHALPLTADLREPAGGVADQAPPALGRQHHVSGLGGGELRAPSTRMQPRLHPLQVGRRQQARIGLAPGPHMDVGKVQGVAWAGRNDEDVIEALHGPSLAPRRERSTERSDQARPITGRLTPRPRRYSVGS